jgi:hypothetical protein
MSTCMQAAALLGRPNGPSLVMQAVRLAIQGCRCDIESECVQIREGEAVFWDTEGASLFANPTCDNDLEFMAMRLEAVAFLEQMGAIARHPEHPTWVTFTAPAV